MLLCKAFIILAFLTSPNPAAAAEAPPEQGGFYVFGDSTVDAGNNNPRGNGIKANFMPYGIDLSRTPTGRFTNGQTIADILGQKLGYPIVEAYHSYPEKERKQITRGMNFASAGCGILHDTTPDSRFHCSNLGTQIQMFSSYINDDLSTILKSPKQRQSHLRSSLFFVSVGSNDFLFSDKNGDDPGKFAKLLAQSFQRKLEDLYEMGARRFIVNNVGPLGCIPSKLKSHHNCDNSLNVAVTYYNWQLTRVLVEFSVIHNEFDVTLADSLQLLLATIMYPTGKQKQFNTSHRCCADESNMCSYRTIPCANRSEFLFFDGAHTSEAANSLFVETCLSGSICKRFVRGSQGAKLDESLG